MGPLKIKGVIPKDRRVEISLPAGVPEGPVDLEVTITPAMAERAVGARDDVDRLGQQPHGRARGYANDRATLDGISGKDERKNDRPEPHRTPNPIRRRGGSGGGRRSGRIF